MLCCLDASELNSNKAYNKQRLDLGVPSFPGEQEYHEIGGTTLADAPSAAPPTTRIPIPFRKNMIRGKTSKVFGDMNLRCYPIQWQMLKYFTAKTIPEGAHSGQTLHVNAQDGTTIKSQIPYCVETRSQFMIEDKEHLRLQMTDSSSTISTKPQHFSTARPLSSLLQNSFVPTVSLNPVVSKHSGSTCIKALIPASSVSPVETDIIPTPVNDCTQDPTPTTLKYNRQKLIRVQSEPDENQNFESNNDSHLNTLQETDCGQKLLLVTVPPGMSPGNSIHVFIPDEPGRIISATVPPNVSEFYLEYIPNDSNATNKPQSRFNMGTVNNRGCDANNSKYRNDYGQNQFSYSNKYGSNNPNYR